jgi:hypothetical protein
MIAPLHRERVEERCHVNQQFLLLSAVANVAKVSLPSSG